MDGRVLLSCSQHITLLKSKTIYLASVALLGGSTVIRTSKTMLHSDDDGFNKVKS